MFSLFAVSNYFDTFSSSALSPHVILSCLVALNANSAEVFWWIFPAQVPDECLISYVTSPYDILRIRYSRWDS